MDTQGLRVLFLRVTSEVFATVIMLRSLSIVIRHTLYRMVSESDTRFDEGRWLLT